MRRIHEKYCRVQRFLMLYVQKAQVASGVSTWSQGQTKDRIQSIPRNLQNPGLTHPRLNNINILLSRSSEGDTTRVSYCSQLQDG